MIYVILWFDTEDYILPASDDAALRLAQFLTQENICATFKLVGEKARTLKRRRRADVITALRKHEIGYHTDLHSIPPTPAQYLSGLGWDEGVAEFDRRERAGCDDVARIFKTTPMCYGQPGSSWGPQAFGAMKEWGMRVYLDAGRHVGLHGRPLYYGGMLTLLQLRYTMRTELGGGADLERAKGKFLVARRKLLAEGGGVVSVYYHPCEFVHREFWDGVNFRRGASPARAQWRLPPVKTQKQQRIAYQTFEAYIQFVKSFPEIRFITASQAARIYRDEARGRTFRPSELRQLAQRVDKQISFQQFDGVHLAASEIFSLLNESVAGRTVRSIRLHDTPLGPAQPPPMAKPLRVPATAVTRAAVDVAGFLRRHRRIPASVWLGHTPVSPERYLRALSDMVNSRITRKQLPKYLVLKPARLAAADYVAQDHPGLWGWEIFPKGFRAPAMMELAKRQAWTLKPATVSPGQEAR